MPKKIDLTGQVFGRLTVLEEGNKAKNAKDKYWRCQCSCGKSVDVLSCCLKKGTTKSCGCLQSEEARRRAFIHGCSNTSAHRIWCNMLDRCNNPNSKAYKYYGGRGISVCDRWKIFENFYADMGDKPAGLSIDRIDNNGNYEPSNCRWATSSEQKLNRNWKNKCYHWKKGDGKISSTN